MSTKPKTLQELVEKSASAIATAGVQVKVAGKFNESTKRVRVSALADKKQSTRLILTECERCEYKARVSRATLERCGAPLCGECLERMEIKS